MREKERFNVFTNLSLWTGQDHSSHTPCEPKEIWNSFIYEGRNNAAYFHRKEFTEKSGNTEAEIGIRKPLTPRRNES